MVIYISYIFVVFLERFIIKPNLSIKRKKLFLLLSFFELLILAGLRGYNVGADTSIYLKNFDDYKGISFRQVFDFSYNIEDYESGYSLLMKICAWLNLDKTVFLFVVAFLIFAPFFFFIKDVPHCEFAILCYFALDGFRYGLGIFRQMIAVALCLLSIRFVIKRHIGLFVLITWIAFFFHKTAILWLVTYPLYTMVHKPKKFIAIAVIISCVMMVVGRHIINIILPLIPRYEHYIGSKYDVDGGSYSSLFIYYALLVVMLLFRYFEKQKTELENFAIIMFGMCLIVQATSYSFALIGRMVIYYSLSLAVLLPYCIQRCIIEGERPIVKVLVFGFLMVLSVYSLNDTTICPYSFFWS